jgi:WD40 repeat protein
MLTAVRLGGSEGREWDADTGRLLRRVENVVHPAAMTTARSPDGKQTVTADQQGVRIADTATGKLLHALEDTAHVNYTGLTWSPDGRSLALVYDFPGKSGLRVAEAATGRLLTLPTDYERAGVWSPDGKSLAVLSPDQRVRLLDPVSYRVARTLEGNIDGGIGLAWSADGKLLAGNVHTSLQVWSLATGKPLWKSDRPTRVAAWSPDGKKLATSDASAKGGVRIYQGESGNLLHEVPLQSSALAWSPDGRFLLAGPADAGEALAIDAGSRAVQLRLKDGVRGLRCARWSPDGKTFTTLSALGLLRVWDAATGEARRTMQLPGVIGYIPSAAWSPDGQMLAWANGDAIHLHDAAGASLGVLLPLGAFGQLAVTADGRYRGNDRIERAIRIVAQKRDGTSETLTVGEFEQKYGFKNDPATVRLTDK